MQGYGALFGLFILCFMFANFAALVTHIVWVFSNLQAENVRDILIFGLLAFLIMPAGIIHGWSLWFNAGDWITPVYNKSTSFLEPLTVVVGNWA